MDHAKKYVLVDPAMYRPSATTTATALPIAAHSSSDKEIQQTLDSQLPDDEKAKLYISTLRRYKAYNQKPAPPKLNLETELSGSLPPSQQHKAKKLIRIIKENPDIDWTDKGELIYKQSVVPKSHVSDLFADALSAKRSIDGPVGWETFDKGLEEVPPTLVKRRKPSKWSKN